MIEALALDVAEFFHARQDAGKAGTRNAAQLADFARLQRSRVDQSSHDAPLLFRDAVPVENGSEAGDHLLPRLQQQQRQIAMSQFSRSRSQVVSSRRHAAVTQQFTCPHITNILVNIDRRESWKSHGRTDAGWRRLFFDTVRRSALSIERSGVRRLAESSLRAGGARRRGEPAA